MTFLSVCTYPYHSKASFLSDATNDEKETYADRCYGMVQSVA